MVSVTDYWAKFHNFCTKYCENLKWIEDNEKSYVSVAFFSTTIVN